MRGINSLALLLGVSVVRGQGTADGIELFHRGQYAKARDMLEKIVAASPDNSVAKTFVALSRAATGSCEAAVGDLGQQFLSNADAALRRLAGIALLQCQLARNRMEDAWPVLAQLQKHFPEDADVLYETAKI